MLVTRVQGTGDDEEEVDVEVEVTGTLQPAEPDVGIMSSYCEDIFARRLDSGLAIELSSDEEARAQELLCDQDNDSEEYC